MLTRGYVVDVDYNSAKLKVRIPILNSVATDKNCTPDDQLMKASYLEIPGVNVQYKVGDVVVIGFENNQLGSPIVLGHLKLSEGSTKNQGARVSAEFNDLNVNNTAILPTSFQFRRSQDTVAVMSFEEIWNKLRG